MRICTVAILALLIPAASAAAEDAECINEQFELALPKKLDGTKLKDGSHLLAAVLTDHGLFQAVAVSKGGTLGDITFY